MPAVRRYGPEHTHLRERLIKRYRPGETRCIRCGLPISDPPSRVHLGHPDEGNGWRYGLEHHSCNEGAAGVKSGQTRRGGKPGKKEPPPSPGRSW